MAALKTHLLRALSSRRDAETAHLKELRRRYALELANAALPQPGQSGSTITGQTTSLRPEGKQ